MFEPNSRLRQLFKPLLDLGQPSDPVVPPSSVEWPSIIWAYCNSLWPGGWNLKNSDRADKECNNRGLSFGQLRVLKAEVRRVNLGLIGEQKITPEQAKVALLQAINEVGLIGRLKLQDGIFDEVVAVLINDDDPLPAVSSHTIRGDGTQFSSRKFLSVNCWGGAGLREMEASSIEALKVLVRMSEILGFSAGPKHYANESPVRIEDIIVYAVRWQDPHSACRYLDVLLRPELVKHQVWHGSNWSDKRKEHRLKSEVLGCKDDGEVWPLQGEVLACEGGGDWWPKMIINNRPVYSVIADEPTQAMLKAKEKFIKDSAEMCSYCKINLATRQFTHVRFEMSDGFGGMSSGAISYACDNPECADKAKETNCVRTEESSYTQEVWD